VVLAISGLLAVGSLILLSFVGLRLSTDFTGGTSVLLRVPDGTTVADLRAVLDGPASARSPDRPPRSSRSSTRRSTAPGHRPRRA
jgi:preprotein translocase subunit SecF